MADTAPESTTQQQLDKCDLALTDCGNYAKSLSNQNTILQNQITTLTNERNQCADSLAKESQPMSPLISGLIGAGLTLIILAAVHAQL